AINAGNAANYPELDENTLDLAGNPRLKNGTIDQGPYQYQSSITEHVIVPDANGVLYVRKDADGNGSSWANATGSLQKAIHGQDVQQVWVEIGNYSIPNNGTFSMKNNVAIYGGFDPDNGIDDLSDERILPDAQNTNLGTILNGNGNRRVF